MENWENLSAILDKAKEDLDRKKFLNELLVEEASKGNKETVKKVLQAGANPNCAKGEFSPLIAALKGDFVDVIDYLFKVGANPGFKATEDFVDAVWFSVLNQKYLPLRKFIRNGCALNMHPKLKKTLLGIATNSSDLTAVTILLGHSRIKVNERDKEGNTALHYNMAKTEMTPDDIEIGRILLAAGASGNIPNNDGLTPQQLGATIAEALILENELENEMPQPSPTAPKKKTLKF